MHLDALGVVVVDDVGDSVELVVDGYHLAGAGNCLDQMGFRLPLLVGIVPIIIEPKDDNVGCGFWWRRGFRSHCRQVYRKIIVSQQVRGGRASVGDQSSAQTSSSSAQSERTSARNSSRGASSGHSAGVPM